MVSFSITGLGNTTLERGVMKYNDLIDRIEKLVQSGDLNPNTTTIRIDPILIGETNFEDVKTIVNRCKQIGIKKFVTSLVQSYGYLDGTSRDRKVVSGINEAMQRDGRTYDWDKYYGRVTNQDYAASKDFVQQYQNQHPKASWSEIVSAGAAQGVRVVTQSNIGKIHFIPKQEYIDEIGKILLEINKDPEIELETCSFFIKGLRASACLDPLIIERITGVDVTDENGRYNRDTSRPDCMCYGAHSDIFRMNEKKCFSSCAYCYAGKSDSNAISYYNEDGTLKDTIYTRTYEADESDDQNNATSIVKPKELDNFQDSIIDGDRVLRYKIHFRIWQTGYAVKYKDGKYWITKTDWGDYNWHEANEFELRDLEPNRYMTTLRDYLKAIASPTENTSNLQEASQSAGNTQQANTFDNTDVLKEFSDKDFEQGRKNKENCKGK